MGDVVSFPRHTGSARRRLLSEAVFRDDHRLTDEQNRVLRWRLSRPQRSDAELAAMLRLTVEELRETEEAALRALGLDPALGVAGT